MCDTYRNTIFIHIPRTSGTSLKWALNNKIQDLEYINENYHKTAIERKEQIGAERWNVCYKFTIVRNPWERAVSWYCRYQTNLSFMDWLMQIDVGQAHYFMDGDNVLVDDVFQYETLDDHLEALCRKANWPLIQRLQNVNNTIHEPYQTYYDLKARKLVAQQCEFEIKRFGYAF